MAFYRRRSGYARRYTARRPYYGMRSRARSYGAPRRRYVSSRRVRFGGRRY